MNVALALVATVLLGASEVAAQRTVRGTVVDTAGAPVAFANVELGSRRVVADDSGRFVLTLSNRPASLYVRRIGFVPTTIDLTAGADTEVTIALRGLAANLNKVVVEAQATVRALELHGFYGRLQDRERGINAGQFITAEEIERRNPFRVTQMLEGRQGVRVVRSGPNCLGSASPCWAPAGTNGCWMTVWLDGQRLTNLRGNGATELDEIVLPTHVAGIEVYTTPLRTPPEYQPLSGTCGTVLIWSK